MPTFKYSGKSRKGERKQGRVEAKSKNQAIAVLREQGIMAFELHEVKQSVLQKDIQIGKQVKNYDFVVYCRQFATLIRSGITIVDATKILAEQTESKGLKKVLFTVDSELREGTAFSDAVEKHPKIFPPIFVNMIRAGEATGNLDETLERLATYFEKQHTIKSKIQSALSYPIVLSVITVAVVVFLMTFVIPRFIDMFADLGAELPWITVAVIATSEIISSFWWLVLLILLIVVTAFIVAKKRSKAFQYTVSTITFRLPIFGKLLQKAAIARMTRTLASLFSSSVPILQSLTIVERVVNNPVMGKVVLQARDSLEQGNSLTAPLKESWIFPPLVTQMIAIGEETGSLDLMLSKVADFYEEEVDRSVDTLKSLIEPIMVVVLAGVVGFIVLAVFIPMFSLFDQFL
ncbi:type II secretion system F family protein [Alkalihalobacillus sp. LMS39]|uniref:type II secretion system F family protein n=1 Tax=Alkalihalobacillus sp. LMS39 TaxID=2924032 RepID=UPI001FB1F992|nr:type II secretion system F family protein [Alkalihalobacillus sp. LMS39]UOE93312.1 type II secretion system F family protein [Alkalihalobacillus sp. LMS39]